MSRNCATKSNRDIYEERKKKKKKYLKLIKSDKYMLNVKSLQSNIKHVYVGNIIF